MRIIGKIPRKVTIACSGGIDSMVVVDFLLRGKREVQLAYFNHDTNNSHDAEKFVKKYGNNFNEFLNFTNCSMVWWETKIRRNAFYKQLKILVSIGVAYIFAVLISC